MALQITFGIVSVIILGLGVGLFLIREGRLFPIFLKKSKNGTQDLIVSGVTEVLATDQASSSEGSAIAQIKCAGKSNTEGFGENIYPIW